MTPILLAMARKAGFSDSIEGWMGEAYADRLEAFAKLIIEHEAAKQSNDEPLMWLMPDGKTVDKWARQFYRDEVGIPLYERPKSPDQAEYERGFIDGMQKQMQSSVDKAVNAMAAKSADTPVAWMDADDNLFYTEEDAYKTGVQPIQPLMRGSNPTDVQRYEPGSFKWNTPADEPVACNKCHGLGYYDEGHENDDGSMSGGNYVECEKCKPADEPVAWVCHGMSSDEVHCLDYEQSEIDAIPVGTMLYTHPPKRKPLTDEQRENIAKSWRGRNWTVGDIIDAIEAAHGITGEQA